jgi:phosphatidylglycerol:prolipoprotein diacylglycerol transferase
MIAMWLFVRSRSKTMWQILDFVAPIVPLGLGFGRIGNFINGELWGKATDVPWGVIYRGERLHASQLYEAALEGFALFAILWWFSAKPRPYMAVSALFLLFYGIFRFFIEFYRVPDAHLEYLALGWVTMGQLLSAPMILIGGFMLIMAYRSHNKKEATA